MVVKKNVADDGVTFTISGIDEYGMTCLLEAIQTTNLPAKRYLITLKELINKTL